AAGPHSATMPSATTVRRGVSAAHGDPVNGINSRRSLALRARSPMVSSVGASGIAPRVDTRPCDGFQAVTPQACAGIRSEPPVSDPSAATTAPPATAAADPDDEPPDMKARSHGLHTRPRVALKPDGS